MTSFDPTTSSLYQLARLHLERPTPEEIEAWMQSLNSPSPRLQAFCYSDLSGVSFAGLDLSCTNFDTCNLQGADFTDATLRNTNFYRCDLRGAKGITLYDGSQELLREIAQIVAASPVEFDMDYWHNNLGCGMTHCIGGWAVHLRRQTELEPGFTGNDLEELYGTQVAALMLLGPEAHCHFFDSNEDALAYLRSFLPSDASQV